MEQIYDVAVIGGGAAGLWALRGLKDKSVIIIEGNDRLGAKLLATGGGKCNFTNRFLAPEHFISSNPHFIKSFLHKLTAEDVLDFVEGHGIPYEERDNGKLFTLSGAASILEALLEEGRGGNHTFMLGCLVQNVSKVEGEAGGQLFSVATSCGEISLPAKWWWPAAACPIPGWGPPTSPQR